MNKNYTYIEDLHNEIGEIPTNGIISRTLYSDDKLKAILFGFDYDSWVQALLFCIVGQGENRRAPGGQSDCLPPDLELIFWA